MSALEVSVCSACGHAAFPAPLLCARCGGADFTATPAPAGVAEHVTHVRRSLRGHEGPPPAIALVRTDAGPVVIARLIGDVRPGHAVHLSAEDGALHAAPA